MADPDLAKNDYPLTEASKKIGDQEKALADANLAENSEAIGKHKSNIMAAFEKLGRDATAMFQKPEFPFHTPIGAMPPKSESPAQTTPKEPTAITQPNQTSVKAA